ncbi:hypothetical protein B0I35DRAFT_21652 [Stachybotrys elegans]|uniref:Derlin n=1 Tax=Stachybotrys elegans TaxID=80388 RepID=A0A8K0T743_9HYPO|nr:hypothetical protein B0I35DRAFT_21652 [Stachybotrys elegans]
MEDIPSPHILRSVFGARYRLLTAACWATLIDCLGPSLITAPELPRRNLPTYFYTISLTALAGLAILFYSATFCDISSFLHIQFVGYPGLLPIRLKRHELGSVCLGPLPFISLFLFLSLNSVPGNLARDIVLGHIIYFARTHTQRPGFRKSLEMWRIWKERGMERSL